MVGGAVRWIASGEVFLNLRFAFKCHCCVDAPTTTYIKWFYLGDIPLNKEQHERMLDNISTEESIRQSISRIIVSINTQVIGIGPFSSLSTLFQFVRCSLHTTIAKWNSLQWHSVMMMINTKQAHSILLNYRYIGETQ